MPECITNPRMRFPARRSSRTCAPQEYEAQCRVSLLAANSPFTANGLWSTTSDSYAMRKLTRPTDRLPALSGVAHIAGDRWGYPYLAGHWEDDFFLFSLCWHADRDNPRQVAHPGVYVAPSWSWAAFGGGLGRNNPLHDAYELPRGTAFVGSHMTLASQDRYGGVTGGYILVRGVFLEAELVHNASGSAMRRNGQSISFSFDHHPSPTGLGNKIVCWWVCSGREWEKTWHCRFLLVLRIRREHHGLVCERIGYKDLWRHQHNPMMTFFAGYRKCLRVAAIV